MSFAYIQGQEAEALAYFERLLNQPLPESDREQLKRLVEQLRRKVESEAHPENTVELTLHNTLRGLNFQKA
ncbi:MAG TPA: hypothetical protein VNX27_01940 [Chthoniobacterales bacterium]|jgi:hypothetical protein|nr:hypothetical protein [Chthoniobacterales bacterium]